MRKILMILSLLFLIDFAYHRVYAEEIKPEEVFKELVSYVYKQNVGITLLWNLDQEKYNIGAKWQWYQSKHQWLFWGLSADFSPSLGLYASFNLGKLIEKIKGEPLVYLKHLEAGYWKMYDFGEKNWKDGLFLNIIKIEF